MRTARRLSGALLLLALPLAGAPQERPPDPAREARLAWFREAKYGLFIHWGLYAIPAGEWQGKRVPGIGEWIMYRARIPVTEYEGLSGSTVLGSGKMLLARLGLRLVPATSVPYATALAAAAAVEMIHAASLLHDDVIDGGYLRRGAPTFWVERGVTGAM